MSETIAEKYARMQAAKQARTVSSTTSTIPTAYRDYNESDSILVSNYLSPFEKELPFVMDLSKPILHIDFQIKFSNYPDWHDFNSMPLYTYGYDYAHNEDNPRFEPIKELYLRVGMDYLTNPTDPQAKANYDTLMARPIVISSGKVGAYSSREVLLNSLDPFGIGSSDTEVLEDTFNDKGSMRGAFNLTTTVDSVDQPLGSVFLNFYEDKVTERNSYQNSVFQLANYYADKRRNGESVPWSNFTAKFELRISGFSYAQTSSINIMSGINL